MGLFVGCRVNSRDGGARAARWEGQYDMRDGCLDETEARRMWGCVNRVCYTR